MAQDLVKSAARALEILELFATERTPLSSAQIGAALGYPKSSLSVLLKSLVTQGYLSVDGADQSLFPTLKVGRLGDWIPDALLGSELLLPMLERLRDDTNETVTLTTASGLHMRCLHALIGTHPIALRVEEGVLFPVIGTAVGTAWLAAQDDKLVAARLERWAKETPARGRKPLAEIEQEIATARSIGFAAMYDAVLSDTGAIAVALEPSGVGETMVVAVAGLSKRIQRSEARIVKTLQKHLSAQRG
jgi:DNA-binding IclR family transcriptional regulator